MNHRLPLIPLAMTFALPSAASVACNKAEADALVAKWTEVFVEDNPERILALYAPDGVLWGTLSPKLRQGHDALRDYFVAVSRRCPATR